jgi:hypothetical protein
MCDILRHTCLSVREDASIVAIECIVKDIPPEALEHGLLRGKRWQGRVQRIEAVIESERLWLFPAKREKH